MLITADAMHCQEEGSTFLVKEKGADYLWTVKENQSTLRSLIQTAFADDARELQGASTLHTKGHGRIEDYECHVKDWTADLANQHSFPFIKKIIMIDRSWCKSDGSDPKSEIRYQITSANAEADELLRASIDHWPSRTPPIMFATKRLAKTARALDPATHHKSWLH